MSGLVLPIASLWWREIVRFLRQRSRVTGGLVQPIVFWLLLGGGFGGSFTPPVTAPDAAGAAVTAGRSGYLEYAYPGAAVMVLLFTAIFSTISVIEDRREGFLQSVLVAPVPRAAIVLGKVLGGTTLAVGEALILLALAPLVGIHIPAGALPAVVGLLVLIAFALTALGFVIAWRMDSTAGFHAIMNLILLPMWILSGAFFPASGAAKPLAWVMAANPLTYGVAALRRLLYSGRSLPSPGIPALEPSLLVTALFGVVMFGAALVIARTRSVPGPS